MLCHSKKQFADSSPFSPLVPARRMRGRTKTVSLSSLTSYHRVRVKLRMLLLSWPWLTIFSEVVWEPFHSKRKLGGVQHSGMFQSGGNREARKWKKFSHKFLSTRRNQIWLHSHLLTLSPKVSQQTPHLPRLPNYRHTSRALRCLQSFFFYL